jgi:DNA repair exonuclease SbcCD ATPase subunit
MSDWGAVGAFVGVGLAGAMAWLWRRAEKRAVALTGELQGASVRSEQLAASLAREEKARRRQAEELAGYRKKTEKARKRASRAPAKPLGTASRLHDLEESLAKLERERDSALAARQTAEQELERVRGLLERATRKSDVVRAPSPAAPSTQDPVAELEAGRIEDRARIAALESELAEARQVQARMRKRVSNQDQLYASIRAELDVKKDRLRRQEEQLERLQALKVAVLD